MAAAREVAVKTGQSRAALIPLAEVGGQGQVLASEIIGEKARGPYTNKEEIEDVRLAGFSNNLGINRSVETGRNLGQGASKIGFGTQHTPRMSLKWAIPVYQYSLHEGRWQSLPQGRQALTESISRNFDSHISVNQMKRQLLRYLRTR